MNALVIPVLFLFLIIAAAIGFVLYKLPSHNPSAVVSDSTKQSSTSHS
jgi:hypothetical protein